MNLFIVILVIVAVITYLVLYTLVLFHPYNEVLLTITHPARVFFMAWRFKNSYFSTWRTVKAADQHRIAEHADEVGARHLLAESVARSIDEIVSRPILPINEDYCWMHSGPLMGGWTCQHPDCRIAETEEER